MKKISILVLSFILIHCALSFAQTKNDSSRKVKLQFVRLDLTKEQYDTINYVLGKTVAEFPMAVAGISIFANHAQVVTVYNDTLLVKQDSVKIVPKKKKK